MVGLKDLVEFDSEDASHPWHTIEIVMTAVPVCIVASDLCFEERSFVPALPFLVPSSLVMGGGSQRFDFGYPAHTVSVVLPSCQLKSRG